MLTTMMQKMVETQAEDPVAFMIGHLKDVVAAAPPREGLSQGFLPGVASQLRQLRASRRRSRPPRGRC